MALDSPPDSHLTPLHSAPADLDAHDVVGDAQRLIDRHRRERDLIGVLRRPEGLIFCYALPRGQDGRACSIECPLCSGTGRLAIDRARPPSARPKQFDLECPLCLSIGVAEPGYSDFAACFQDADLHDARSFADEAGHLIVIEPLPTDAMVTLAQAHAYLMRQ